MKLSNMSKEELELLSYTKIAKMYLEENKTTKNTADLFREVCNLLELPESVYQDKIADFFRSIFFLNNIASPQVNCGLRHIRIFP